MFAALTRLPVQPRIHPTEAGRIITDNILPDFEVVPIGKADYPEALNMMASRGWIGAKIYDALLLHCAAKCVVQRSTPSISGSPAIGYGGSASENLCAMSPTTRSMSPFVPYWSL